MPKEASSNDIRMQQLFDAAHRDRSLKISLLNEPETVAKEWGVKFGREEIDRLQKLGAFMQMADEAKLGTLFRVCDPKVCYPSTVWLQQEITDLVAVFIPPQDPIFYPVELVRRRFAPFGRMSAPTER